MNVQEFLIKFKSDIPDTEDPNYLYSEWKPLFFNKTAKYHKLVIASYFEQVNNIIGETNYDLYYPELVLFARLELFTESDQPNFAKVISKLSDNLLRIQTLESMKQALNFIYPYMDFIFHYVYPCDKELMVSLLVLKSNILKTETLDKEKVGELVIRFIDLMLPREDRG